MIAPTPFRSTVPDAPSGGPLARAARAVLVERRLPYVVRQRVDRAMKKAGFVQRTRRVGPFRVSFRRLSTDEEFIETVLEREEYFRQGYRPARGETVIDVGANMGTFTLACAKYGARVIAVEPHPENLAYLTRNVAQNGIEAQVIPAAVGAKSGTCRLFVGTGTGFHSVKFDRGMGAIEVPQVTLGEVIERASRCDLLKIDCEGAEFDFLPTVSAKTWARVRRLVMEYSVPIESWESGKVSAEQIARKRELSDELVALIQANGFRIDAYEDCAGFRAGFIFATNPQFTPKLPTAG